jgi:IS1 transposase
VFTGFVSLGQRCSWSSPHIFRRLLLEPQHTQKIERKHTALRARIKRLVRKAICFAKSIQKHDLVIGLCINRVAYGRAVCVIDQLM